MAIAAVDLVFITWWQFWLGVAGIILLTGTLIYTRKASIFARVAANAAKDAVAEAKAATKAAEDAVEVTRNIGMAQTRAYVTITKIHARISNQAIDVQTSFKNTGDTPTKNLRVSAAGAYRTGNNIIFPGNMNTSKRFPSDIASAEDFTLDHAIIINIDENERTKIIETTCTLFVDIRIQFEDVFDQTIDETLRYWQSTGPSIAPNAYRPLSPRLPADPEK